MERQLASVKPIENILGEEQADSEVISQWKKVAMVVDRLLLVVITMAVTVIPIAIFMNRPSYDGDTAEDSVAALLEAQGDRI